MSAQRPRPWHDPTPLEGYEPAWAGQFDTFQDWVSHASRALTDGQTNTVKQPMPAVCIDAKGRRCTCGGDFMRAREEDAFPVRYFWEFAKLAPPNSRGTATGGESKTCGPDDCQQSGICDGYNCLESGKVRPRMGKHFACEYPRCDCAISFPDGYAPGPAECPSPCNPYGEDVLLAAPAEFLDQT